MGQYHITVNLDKKEYIHPHRLGDGLKLWEQGASQGGTLNALHALLAVSNGRGGGDYVEDPHFVGRWGGDRIAIVGDYAEAKDLPGVDYAEFIYAACGYTAEEAKEIAGTDEWRQTFGPLDPEEWVDISDLARDFLSDQWNLEFGDDGWVSRKALPGSPFVGDDEPPTKPDMIIGG